MGLRRSTFVPLWLWWNGIFSRLIPAKFTFRFGSAQESTGRRYDGGADLPERVNNFETPVNLESIFVRGFRFVDPDLSWQFDGFGTTR